MHLAPRVVEPSRDELEARRRRLLDHVGMTRDELDRAAQAGTLTSEQYWVWEDVTSTEFLLGEDDGRQ